MKKKNIMIIMAIIIITTGCQENQKKVDLVHEIKPVNNWSEEKNTVLDQLKFIPEKEQSSFLRKNWPKLTNNLISFLKGKKIINPKNKLDSVCYFYGSEDKVRALDHAGVEHAGYFKDQLVAFIYLHNKKNPLAIIVRCTNGLFDVVGANLEYVMTETNFEFTIEKGRGIAYYVGSDKTAIQIAGIFNRPLFEGKGIKGKRITPRQASRLDTRKKQVTVLVYEGDYFNLSTMKYRPAK